MKIFLPGVGIRVFGHSRDNCPKVSPGGLEQDGDNCLGCQPPLQRQRRADLLWHRGGLAHAFSRNTSATSLVARPRVQRPQLEKIAFRADPRDRPAAPDRVARQMLVNERAPRLHFHVVHPVHGQHPPFLDPRWCSPIMARNIE